MLRFKKKLFTCNFVIVFLKNYHKNEKSIMDFQKSFIEKFHRKLSINNDFLKTVIKD